MKKLYSFFIHQYAWLRYIIGILLIFVIVFLFGCKKEKCYTCSTSDNGTGYIWDVEYLCGENNSTNYISTFNDANNMAECVINE